MTAAELPAGLVSCGAPRALFDGDPCTPGVTAWLLEHFDWRQFVTDVQQADSTVQDQRTPESEARFNVVVRG